MLSVLKRGVEPSVSTRALIANGGVFLPFLFLFIYWGNRSRSLPFSPLLRFSPSPLPLPFFRLPRRLQKSRVESKILSQNQTMVTL